MIDKKCMKFIKKYLEIEDSILLSYFPTEKEKEYLKKFNIKTEKVISRRIGLVTDYYYETEYCRYYIEK